MYFIIKKSLPLLTKIVLQHFVIYKNPTIYQNVCKSRPSLEKFTKLALGIKHSLTLN